MKNNYLYRRISGALVFVKNKNISILCVKMRIWIDQDVSTKEYSPLKFDSILLTDIFCED